jgi:hypothetical protein
LAKGGVAELPCVQAHHPKGIARPEAVCSVLATYGYGVEVPQHSGPAAPAIANCRGRQSWRGKEPRRCGVVWEVHWRSVRVEGGRRRWNDSDPGARSVGHGDGALR